MWKLTLCVKMGRISKSYWRDTSCVCDSETRSQCVCCTGYIIAGQAALSAVVKNIRKYLAKAC
jgi:hypothetical protein